jgi:hypothetical protein
MFQLCIVTLLLVSPAVAVRNDYDAEKVEVDFLDEKAELVMDGAARVALGAEVLDDDVTAHGVALLSMFTNLSASKEEIASKFEMSPSLKQLVHDDLKNGPHARTNAARASLLERAKGTLSEHEANGFEHALRRKDATPCVCFLLSYQGLKLIDLDRPNAQIFDCGSQCLNGCKSGGGWGDNKFVMDPGEAAAIGAEGVHQPVVAAKCGAYGNSCECLDATESVARVRNANARFGMRIDAARQQQVFTTETECMHSCRCQDFGGADYEGLCVDEWYGD